MARRGNDDPSIPDVATGNNTEPDLVPMKNKFIQKFYEPVVILSALMESAKKVIPPATSVLSPFDKGNNRETYHSFVYKLAHVCTSDQAKTITAFMILRHEEDSDRAHYMFASNGRKPGELEETAEFVRELLRMAGSASPNKPLEQRIRIRREVFTLVLRFNRPRIKMYLQKLRARIEKCQQECRKERTEENTRINEELEDLLRPINAVTPHCSENTCKSLPNPPTPCDRHKSFRGIKHGLYLLPITRSQCLSDDHGVSYSALADFGWQDNPDPG